MSNNRRLKLQLSYFIDERHEELLRARARMTGQPMTKVLDEAVELLCQKIISKQIVLPAINKEQWAKLSTLSSNLNQIAYKLNSNQKTELQSIEEAKLLLSEVRHGLLNNQ